MDKIRVCIDLDGTICEIKKPNETYADVKVKKGAKEFIDSLREQGCEIVINTARNMKTCGHNVGKVMKNVGQLTFEWLKENGIYYDEIFFGKPNAHITIDDRVVRFESWDKLSVEQIKTLARER